MTACRGWLPCCLSVLEHNPPVLVFILSLHQKLTSSLIPFIQSLSIPSQIFCNFVHHTRSHFYRPSKWARSQRKKPFYSSQKDSEDFWKVEADDHEFWDAYVSTRPNYSQSFYQFIHDYHSSHSSSHDLAHDVGCGAGQVTAELTNHYTHVIASDTDADHLAVAKARLTAAYDESRVSYTHSKAEDLCTHHATGSADMIAAAEVIVLMDRETGLQSFARILKPGGTLAAWFYGRPTFSSSALLAEAQPILDQIMVLNWQKVISGSGPRRAWGFKRCADAMASWLDFLPFSADTWTDVRRYKWNTHGTLPFFGKEACGYEIEATSNVVEGEEKEVIEEDHDFWVNEWDIAALKEYFRVLFPGFREAIGEGDKEIDALFGQLGEIMGGDGKSEKFTWPVALVLATRR
ncbi:MAG: hypothetical protein Q9166_007989 [cf. Caloplaca sp. 2 TL-2023]